MTENEKKQLLEKIEELKGDSSTKAKGIRLRYLREYVNLERREAAEIAGVQAGTLKDWEIGYFNLPRRRIDKFIEYLTDEGFICSGDWVEFGEGCLPKWGENKKIKAELETFFTVNADAVSLVVNDEGMLPFYKCGDIVAGVKLGNEDINLALNKDCIIELCDGTLLLRGLRKSHSGLYNLVCTNFDMPDPIIQDISIKSAAPVIWLRRKLF